MYRSERRLNKPHNKERQNLRSRIHHKPKHANMQMVIRYAYPINFQHRQSGECSYYARRLSIFYHLYNKHKVRSHHIR
jgi:hypothetical protein